jgi:glycosyltransferase involved in cell wall biosynthesis
MKSSHQYRAPKLRVHFVVTSLPVGGAETLLLNLIQKMDRSAFNPEVVCLKEPGPLGDAFAEHVPLHSRLLASKWDLRVVLRLAELFRTGPADAVITVGAGDKMFWGRLSARLAGVPVICSALHSSGWPDGVGRLNRMLTPITDGFIACANKHAEHLASAEGFPLSRVFMIPNGIDADRFRPNHTMRARLRSELGIPEDCPIVGIVAALRPEKNHAQFVEAAREILRNHPNTRFVVVGDGPERSTIENLISEHGLSSRFHMLGNRNDTEYLLAGMDVFCLTSRNEANPVSIMEALATGIPVVSPNVGSIHETVVHKRTGLLTKPLSPTDTADAVMQLLSNPQMASEMGLAGRQLVRSAWSLETMVQGYENLIAALYNAKAVAAGLPLWERPAAVAATNPDAAVPQPLPAPYSSFASDTLTLN